MLKLILMKILVIACAYGAYQLAKLKFDDNNKLLRIITTIVLMVVLFGIGSSLLDLVMGEGNIEKSLQKDPFFMALKTSHPQEYQQLAQGLNTELKNKNLTDKEVVGIAIQQMLPIVAKLTAKASDKARSQYATAYAKNIEILKLEGDTLCYDVMFEPKLAFDKKDVLKRSYEQSGMSSAALAIINDSGVDKVTASDEQIAVAKNDIAQELSFRYGKDLALLANPQKAMTAEDKRKVCQISADMIAAMNKPNDPARMTLLRNAMEAVNDSSVVKVEDAYKSSPQVAQPPTTSKPQMAAPVH